MTPFKKIIGIIRKLIFIQRNYATFVFVLRHRKAKVDLLFRASWRLVRKYQAGTITGMNVYDITDLEVLHYEYRQVFKFFFPSFCPEVIASDRALLEKMTFEPCLIATVHAYNEFSICKLLDQQSLPTAFVSHSPYDLSEVANYQISRAPLNIPSTPKLFLDLRAAIRSGLYVVCDVDFVIKKRGKSPPHFVSISAFQFHLTTGLPLYFACNRVQENGVIQCFFEKTNFSRDSRADEAAQKFIAFVNRVQARQSNLVVGDWDVLTKNRRHRYSMGNWTRNRVQS